MTPTRSVIAVALLGIGMASDGARPPATAPAAQPAVISEAEAQAVRQRLQEGFRASPSQISRTAFGWYEVLVNGELLYLDPQLNYVFNGSVLDARTRANVTQSRRDELLRVDFAKLPLEHAVALKFGNGSRRFASFEDPNCGFCRKLHQDIKGLQDATLYVFVMPSLSPDSREKARAIWCAADRAASWNGLVMENRAPAPAGTDCRAPTDSVVALGRTLGVRGTPTLIFEDGSRASGAIGLPAIEQRLQAAREARAGARPSQPW